MYGLNSTFVAATPQHLNLIDGFTTLGVTSYSPEGVLLKSVADLQEGIACGGIMLANHLTGEYVIYVGETLREVLSRSQLGQIRSWALSNGAQSAFTLTTKEGTGSHDFVEGLVLNPPQKQDDYTPSGYLQKRLPITHFFSAGSSLLLFGVVCSATEGMLVSHVRDLLPTGAINAYIPTNEQTEPLGYMATIVDLPFTLSEFMRRVADAAIGQVPSSLRSYYQSTLEAALAAHPDRDTKLNFAVSSFWRSGVLESGSLYGPRRSTFERSMASILGTGLVGGWPAAVTSGSAAGNGPYVRTSTSGWIERRSLPGAFSPGSRIPYLVEDQEYCNRLKTLVAPTGVAGGLQCGVIRDFHVLHRSLALGQRFASTSSPFSTLNDLVQDSVVPHAPEAFAASGPATSGPGIIASVQDHEPERTMYSVGNAQPLLESFLATWDGLALEAAK